MPGWSTLAQCAFLASDVLRRSTGQCSARASSCLTMSIKSRPPASFLSYRASGCVPILGPAGARPVVGGDAVSMVGDRPLQDADRARSAVVVMDRAEHASGFDGEHAPADCRPSMPSISPARPTVASNSTLTPLVSGCLLLVAHCAPPLRPSRARHWSPTPGFSRFLRRRRCGGTPCAGSPPEEREGRSELYPSSVDPVGIEGSLASGRSAPARPGRKRAAHSDAALKAGETVEALEGLGVAARWQMDGAAALAAHERAYRLARESGTRVGARLRSSWRLTAVSFAARRRSSGWLERAGHLLGAAPAAARACGARLSACEPRAQRRPRSSGGTAVAAAASLRRTRPARSTSRCSAWRSRGSRSSPTATVRERHAAARRGDDRRRVGRSRERADRRGDLLPSDRRVPAGARPRARGRVVPPCRGDLRRYADAEMFCTCRTHYADVLVWRGAWQRGGGDARGGLPRARRRSSQGVEGMVRLAELVAGRVAPDQAEALLAERKVTGRAAGARGARLDRKDAQAAAEEAQRFLRRVGGDRFERVPALELLVRAPLSLGDPRRAQAAVDELERTVARRSVPHRSGPPRWSRAVAQPRRASDGSLRSRTPPTSLPQCGARYDAAQAQLELAGCALRAEGRVRTPPRRCRAGGARGARCPGAGRRSARS